MNRKQIDISSKQKSNQFTSLNFLLSVTNLFFVDINYMKNALVNKFQLNKCRVINFADVFRVIYSAGQKSRVPLKLIDFARFWLDIFSAAMGTSDFMRFISFQGGDFTMITFIGL